MNNGIAVVKAQAVELDLAITAREACEEIERRRRRTLDERAALDREIALLDAVRDILGRFGGEVIASVEIGGANGSSVTD